MSAFGYSGPAASDDELGVWQPLARVEPRDLALESAVPHEDEVNLWQVALPADRIAAMRTLALAEARLVVSQNALPFAAARLTAFAVAGGPPPLHATGLPPGMEQPELELASWLAISHSAASFGSWERPHQPIDDLLALPAFVQTAEKTEAFFDKVRAAVRNFALIDTRLADARAALTVVGWTGAMRTAWSSGLAVDDARQHVRAVSLALRTRDAWVRLALTILRGAVQLAVLFPANPVLALPSAYRFIRQIIDQVQALPELA